MRTAEPTHSSTSFLLDGMLGSLARWLRIAGFDTLYYVDKDDSDLIKEAFQTGRVLLTRDEPMVQLAKKSGVTVILVFSQITDEQLSQIKECLGLVFFPTLSRCPVCNGELSQNSREDVRGDIPESSLNTFEEFWRCASCQKVYWKGSHWENILETLSNT